MITAVAAAATALCVTRSLIICRLASSIKTPRHSHPPLPQFPAAGFQNRTMASSADVQRSGNGGGGEKKTTAPYGSWRSPITADVVSGAEKRLGGFSVAGDGRLVWIETRPQENG